MNKTKLLVVGALMACIAALFQITPVYLSEAFVILTMFSAIPIFIIAWIKPKIGIAASLASFILISLLSIHEAMIFAFANAPVGIVLGCCSHYTNKKHFIVPIAATVQSCTLIILNFAIGIPIFGVSIPGAQIIQVLIIATFSLVYNFIYLYICGLILGKLKMFII